MDEQLLADVLKGKTRPAELGQALLSARLQPDTPAFRTSANFRVIPLQRPVEITGADVDRLLAALEAGELSEEQAGIAAFLLEAQERFQWDTDTQDGTRVADVLFWLGMPQINYPLTPANLASMRIYLRTGQLAPSLDRGGASA